ncbi:cTAGE family member 2 isoform X2 [Hippocampus zosterae]|uniref:cTAGE family member 2 isoform X2 n=1 Tax=Hippocampus zosterae TaxID=109293 RepID=UPI00223CD42B|nr:cTAGE family member 2 isoform X2 [Hippocampus zosterae]
MIILCEDQIVVCVDLIAARFLQKASVFACRIPIETSRMTLSQAAIMSTNLFFVLWPQLSGGLLSDFKICGDSQCESLMSRVQAVRDHHGKDCRFLSFRKGETISVYHKLTGKRSHLWAGSMNKQFGYFLKEAVKEEQTYATKEIVVVTQESDFLCTNEFGYLIDSSHLNTNDDDDDYDDDNDDNSGLRNPEELETSQTRNHHDDTNAGMSKDSAPESFSTSREEIENQDNGAAKTKQESPETAVELKEEGGSPASSWLSSSVAGWFGVGKKEEPENSAEVHKKRLMPGEDLLPSSVAGWLGLRSEGKSDSAKHDENRGKQDRKTVESSTMIGRLGFGGDEKPDSSAEKENDDVSELYMKTTAGENFRSRKLHLEIETLAEQEKKINDMGTLGWLANGLSTTLGFGLDDQDPRETIQVGTEEVDVKETAFSWFDLGISSILAFRKNNNEGDRTESHIQSDNILQGHVDSNIQDKPANNKDSEVDDASKVDQNANPPQNQRTDINLVPHAQQSCIGASCSTSRKDKETMETVGVMVQEQNDGGPEKNQEDDSERASEKMSLEENVKMSQSQTAPPQLLEGVTVKNQDSIHRIQKRSSSQTHGMDFVKWLKMKVVSSLPYDIRPGPDLDGIPWELIIISSLVGLVTLLFSCRCYSSVKSRLYRRKEWRMADQVAQLLEEKCEVLETLSKCQQEYNELETSRSESDTLAQTHEIDLEVRAQQLDLANTQLEESLQELKDQLDQQRLHREEQEQKVTLLEQSMETIQEETKELQSQEQQAQTTIKVYDMNSERLQRNQETAGEENSLLIESNTQLSQQVEGWAERVSELEEEMRRYELAHSGMVQDVANKDERIMSLTDRLLGMKAWDADLEEDGGDSSKGATGRAERNGKVDGTKSEIHLQKVQKLIYAAKLNADLKSVDEDKDRVFAKLNDEIKAKEDLEVSIKELENEQLSMQADTERYNEQVQRLQQKLQIMTEMYQENELKLHRLLTVEEKERLQKEDKLNKADKNIALAIEELNNYKLRAGEMEEELEKTKQSYQTQISAHEKKAHNNWLAARAADRELSDIKRENALLRQKLTDTQFKLDALDREPFTLDSVARPLPFRAERLPFGPSPLGRPASENRALLSPPTLLEGPLNRLSPRGTRGPVEPPCAHGELEQTGGPHSDSGSISPSWERDRRGPPLGAPGPFPPQGCMFPEPGGPIYRRPGPPPGMIAPLPPPGPPFPLPRALPNPGPLGPIHYADTTDGTNREHSLGPEQDHQEPTPSDGRTPPLRRGTAPPSGPPIGPIDGPFPRRAPFGPPDFFPPRGPGGPPMMPMWAPRPGMMFPPLYAHGGPPPPPHPLSYGPPMRPPPPDGLPPPSVGPPVSQQNLPPVPRSQSQDELTSAP